MKTTCRNIFITGTILIWLIKFGLRSWLYLPPYSAGLFPDGNCAKPAGFIPHPVCSILFI